MAGPNAVESWSIRLDFPGGDHHIQPHPRFHGHDRCWNRDWIWLVNFPKRDCIILLYASRSAQRIWNQVINPLNHTKRHPGFALGCFFISQRKEIALSQRNWISNACESSCLMKVLYSRFPIDSFYLPHPNFQFIQVAWLLFEWVKTDPLFGNHQVGLFIYLGRS